jgi:serpin B
VDSTQANDTFPVQPAEEKKKNNKTGLFVLIAIIIFLLIGCGIFFAISSNKGNNNNNNNQGGNNQKEEVGDKLARELDVKLLKDWGSAEENALYSPLSIKNVLAMLAEATDGETKQEVVDLIGENYEPRKYANNKNMTIANALFVRDDFKELIKNSYIDLIKEKYNANTIYDPFNNAATVNDWAYKNTLSLIPKVLEDKDVQRMDYFWINAVAIDMNWVNNFQCSFNDGKESGKCIEYSVGYPHTTYGAHGPPYESENPSPVDFNGKGKVNSLMLGATINNYDIVNELGEDYIRNTVKEAYDKWKASANESDIEAMEKEGFPDFDSYFKPYLEELKKPYGDLKYSTDFRISNDENFKVFAKDLQEYGGTQLEYVAVMPKKTTLKEFVNDASVEKIDEITSYLKEIKNENFSDKKVTKIIGNIPIFNYDINYDFVKELKKLGVKGIFEDKANFSPMTDSDLVKVTDGVHVATIDFSNEGIKAAAVTTLGGIGDGGFPFDYYWDLPTEEIDMTFNKPYMYIIRDKANGEVWFMGTVYEPTAAK